MRNEILLAMTAITLAACAPPTIQALESKPTVFQPQQVEVELDPATAAIVTPPVEFTSEAQYARMIPDPSSAIWTLVAGDFRRPVAVEHADDERLFIVEQEGLIWIIQNNERLTEPFLDLRQLVNDNASEQGLLGLAFHPDYAETGTFFVNYTGGNGETRISRYSRSEDPHRADAASETLLLTIHQPFRNHNGGSLAFGPDGFLYVGTGDGGSAGDPLGNSQRLDTLLGKILRLDVDSAQPYAIPADNPFAEGGALPEIWAYGLRNPWRFAFDQATGDLFIADVGQNQWEEINVQDAKSPGGENYGWNLREGTHAYVGGDSGLTDPVVEYSHSDGCSVTGGEVVRDPRLPDWSGLYLYGDYCKGWIWGLLADDMGTWTSQLLYESNFTISSFGQDAAGNIYLVDYRGGVYRLDPTS